MTTPYDPEHPPLHTIAQRMLVKPAEESAGTPMPPTVDSVLPGTLPEASSPKAPTSALAKDPPTVGSTRERPSRPADNSLFDAVEATRAHTRPAPPADPISYTSALTRPNGEKYLPRRVRVGGSGTGLYDVEALRKSRESGIPVLLTGSPGTGKTAMVEAAFPDVITLAGTVDTETADFLGSYTPHPEGNYPWVDGPLLEAMTSGVPLFIDEIALIDPRVLAVVYSVMDGRDEIRVTANPARGTVKAAPGFYVIGACNPNVPGAVMSDALLSRFKLQIEVSTDYDMVARLGVLQEIVTVAQNLAGLAADSKLVRAPETRELLSFQKVLETFGLPVALGNLITGADPLDRPTYVSTINSTFGSKVGALHL